MVAEERYEREEKQRTARGAMPAERDVEQVSEVRRAGNVTPLPMRPNTSATNVNVAERPLPAAAVNVAPNYAALAVGKANQVLWFVCAVLELLLGLRVLLRLVGASAAAPFVRFVYGVTLPFAASFLGMLPNLGAAGSAATSPAAGAPTPAVLEVPTLVAMVVYFIAFLLLTSLLRLLVSRPARV